jgi:hypothetical protein
MEDSLSKEASLTCTGNITGPIAHFRATTQSQLPEEMNG